MATIQEHKAAIGEFILFHKETYPLNYQSALDRFEDFKRLIDLELSGEVSGELRTYIQEKNDVLLDLLGQEKNGTLLDFLGDEPLSAVIEKFVDQAMRRLVAGRHYYAIAGRDPDDDTLIPCGCWYGHRTYCVDRERGEAISTAAVEWFVTKTSWDESVTPIEYWLIVCDQMSDSHDTTLDPHKNIRFLMFLQYLVGKYELLTATV